MNQFHENPFSTKHVRPGAIAYRLPKGKKLEDLAERFDHCGRLGQIVGPHGGGKSSLLADLIRLWETAGEQPVVFELHDGQRRLPIPLSQLIQEKSPTLIAVDGYEQLGWTSRRKLLRVCRRPRIRPETTSVTSTQFGRGVTKYAPENRQVIPAQVQSIGLVVTCHASLGLPDLVRCAPSLATVEQLVRDRLQDQPDTIPTQAIHQSFSKHQGNVREILFEMYDLYQQQYQNGESSTRPVPSRSRLG